MTFTFSNESLGSEAYDSLLWDLLKYHEVSKEVDNVVDLVNLELI